MPISNASLEDENCSDISDWNDVDIGEAVSEQITFDGEETFKFDTKTSADTDDDAGRKKDTGSVEGLGNRVVISIKLYLDLVGTCIEWDVFRIDVCRSDWKLSVCFASDGIYIYDGSAWNKVGAVVVTQDVWQEWTFDVDLSGGVGNAICDIYLNDVLQSSDVDCSYDTGSWVDGDCVLRLIGFSTDNLIAYVDWFKVGDGFAVAGWTGKFCGVTNPTKINGISVANIAKVNGVA